MSKRRSDFIAEHLRPPTREEQAEIERQEREDRRQEAAARRENDLRRAYLGTPGATPEQWANEKATILAKDREDQAIKNRDAASRAQASLYSKF
jgi:hypothetical protein